LLPPLVAPLVVVMVVPLMVVVVLPLVAMVAPLVVAVVLLPMVVMVAPLLVAVVLPLVTVMELLLLPPLLLPLLLLQNEHGSLCLLIKTKRLMLVLIYSLHPSHCASTQPCFQRPDVSMHQHLPNETKVRHK
jgi:hypothetical protein